MLTAAAAVAGAVALAGCETDGVDMAKAMKPLPADLVAQIEAKNMTKDSPILVRIFKEESELEVWKQDNDGRFALLKTYPICRWSGELGPKIREGDRQAPEGFYTITPAQMNPKSAYYLSFNLGYPNAFDKAHGRTGAHLMVHGDCSSRGCYSMTDEQIGEIFALGREAFFGGQKEFQVQAYPFRMTPLNMARHRNSPHLAFWKNIKQGYDYFESTGLQPKVDVCEKRYVFNAEQPANATRPLNFSPAGKCPAFEVQPDIAMAFAAKDERDKFEYAQLVKRGTPTVPVRTGRDGGMHPTFLAKLNAQENRKLYGDDRFASGRDDKPLGSYVNPPRDPDPVSAIMVAEVPLPRPSPLKKTGSAPQVAHASGGLPHLGNGFVSSVMSLAAPGSGADRAGASASSRRGSDGLIGRARSTVSRLIGLDDDDKRPRVTTPKQMAVARPTPPASPGRTVQAPPTPPAPPAKPPVSEARAKSPEPPPAPAPKTTGAVPDVMAGAQPMMKTDSFESRFGGLR
jgi:murein L,D-transpeptidase YafK